MAIDNIYDAIDKQYPDDDGGVVGKLAKYLGAAKLLKVPLLGDVASFFSFLASKSTTARLDRALAFIHEMVPHLERLDTAYAKMPTAENEVKAATSIAMEYDVAEFNDLKRERYIATITNTISSETKVHDVVSFIQDIERLGERDLLGLKVLNRVMNREGDWKDKPNPGLNNPPRLHPNVFLGRTGDLVVEMAATLTGDPRSTDSNNFSREEGLQICLRLQGFGLAQVLDGSGREVPISNYCARPTTRGLMLLKLLDEDVPNWNRYFGPNGPL